MLDMKDKVVIITGAGGGMGTSIRKLMLDRGAIVLGIDKIPYSKSESKREYLLTGNLNDDLFSTYLVSYIEEEFDEIHCIVNCAGVTRATMKESLDTNLLVPYNLITSIIYLMKDRGGSIVNITSLESFQGFPNSPEYAASKGGLSALTKSMARDYGKYNIRVNAIVPGYTRTNMTKESMADELALKDKMNRMILKRIGEPDDIAYAVLFLCSDEASYITGTDLFVDGGWHAKGL